jgi:hypothetical protein
MREAGSTGPGHGEPRTGQTHLQIVRPPLGVGQLRGDHSGLGFPCHKTGYGSQHRPEVENRLYGILLAFTLMNGNRAITIS